MSSIARPGIGESPITKGRSSQGPRHRHVVCVGAGVGCGWHSSRTADTVAQAEARPCPHCGGDVKVTS